MKKAVAVVETRAAGKANRKQYRASLPESKLQRLAYRQLQLGFVPDKAFEPARLGIDACWSVTDRYTGALWADYDEDSKIIAAGRHAGDGEWAEVVLYTESGKQIDLIRLRYEFDIWSIYLLPGAKEALIEGGETLLRLDLETAEYDTYPKRELSGCLLAVDARRRRMMRVEPGVGVVVDDVSLGRELASFGVAALQGEHLETLKGALAPDGRHGAFVDGNGVLNVFPVRAGARPRQKQVGHTAFRQVCIDPRGELIAATEQYGRWRARFWRMDTLEEVQVLPDKSLSRCHWLGFYSDGAQLVVREEDELVYWDMATSRVVARATVPFVLGTRKTSGFCFWGLSDGRSLIRTDMGALMLLRAP